MLAEGGYKGYYCFEWEKKWHPEIEEPEVAFPHYARTMREYLAEAGVKAERRPEGPEERRRQPPGVPGEDGPPLAVAGALPALGRRRPRRSAPAPAASRPRPHRRHRLDPGHGLRQPVPDRTRTNRRPSRSSRRPSASASNYFDTAVDYGDGESETRVGRFLSRRRAGRLPRDEGPDPRAHARRRAQGGRGEPRAAADRPRRPAAPPQPRRRGGPREDRGGGRRAQGALRAARAEGRAVHRHDQPHGRRGHGDGHRAERPRLRADGHEPGAGRGLRGAGAARGRGGRTSA